MKLSNNGFLSSSKMSVMCDLARGPQTPSWAASLGRKSEEAGDEECVEGVLERDPSGDAELGLEECSCEVRAIGAWTPAASEGGQYYELLALVLQSRRIIETLGSKCPGECQNQFDKHLQIGQAI